MEKEILKKILIVGDAGRGKTTLAAKISTKLRIPHYSTDDFYYEVKFSKARDRPESIVSNLKKNRQNCLNCQKETARVGYKYCSNKCQNKYQRFLYIKKWKKGEISGLQSLGTVSTSVKIYLREKYDDKCCLCGWSEINSKTRVVPLVADHIDGNWRNNIEKNLRLLCPNCDALSLTYAGLNRGNGRKNRVLSQRVKEGRLLVKNRPI